MTLPAVREQPAPPAVLAITQAADRLAAALPKHFTPERMAQIVSVATYRTPDLNRCDRESLITSVIHVGTLGLDVTPGTNEAHLIPRKNRKTGTLECTVMLGYKGLEKLAVGTGLLAWIQPREVCEGDQFRIRFVNHETHIIHEPAYGRGRGPLTHVYAVARLTNGDSLVEVMTAEDVEEIHRRTDSYRYAQSDGKRETGPWATDWTEMAFKTVVRRICKRLPRSAATPEQREAWSRMDLALQLDNRQFEDANTEHHAENHTTNNTGHGKGAYASPTAVSAYNAWLTEFVMQRNEQWIEKRCRDDHGGIKPGASELIPRPSAVSEHLVAWGRDSGLISAPERPRADQLAKFAAILLDRHPDETRETALHFARRLWLAKVRAEDGPRVEDEPQAEAVPAEHVSQEPGDGDEPDVDYPDGWEPGAEG